MNNLSTDKPSKEDYNNIPVYYCKSCLSLAVKTVLVDSNLDFCDNCGSTDIGVTTIDEWKKLYKERYGFDYLNNKL